MLSYIKLNFATIKCVPVHFLNKLGHTPTLRIIMTCYTLIFQILVLPKKNLANATFETSLAFQMREETSLEKIKFRILDFRVDIF